MVSDETDQSNENIVTKHPNVIIRDEEIRNEYIFLKNYHGNILLMRKLLLKTALYSIQQIEEDKFPLGTASDKGKNTIKSMFQMDALSNLMMNIEDLVVLSEAFRREVFYYELLDITNENQDDVGTIIRDYA